MSTIFNKIFRIIKKELKFYLFENSPWPFLKAIEVSLVRRMSMEMSFFTIGLIFQMDEVWQKD